MPQGREHVRQLKIELQHKHADGMRGMSRCQESPSPINLAIIIWFTIQQNTWYPAAHNLHCSGIHYSDFNRDLKAPYRHPDKFTLVP